ncbi:hypothetical protein Mro03_71060 [Microbispora rosea subsp. rosea]|nr:hypothetical protein Mro03_71060 [Microbispora rosea subsp. rosea]
MSVSEVRAAREHAETGLRMARDQRSEVARLTSSLRSLTTAFRASGTPETLRPVSVPIPLPSWNGTHTK